MKLLFVIAAVFFCVSDVMACEDVVPAKEQVTVYDKDKKGYVIFEDYIEHNRDYVRSDPENAKNNLKTIFDKMDTNADGKVTVAEIQADIDAYYVACEAAQNEPPPTAD